MEEEYRQAFTEETGELLAELETALLELEQTPEDGDLIGRVFRAMHTMKGSSGMFGFEAMSRFTHEVESIFDLVRSDVIPVDKELISLTLEAVDHIKEIFNALLVGTKIDASKGRDIIERLKLLEPDSASSDVQPLQAIEAFLGVLTEYEISRLRSNLNKNRPIYSARQTYPIATIDSELDAIRQKLKEGGELLSTIPRQHPVPSGFIGFEILFATTKERPLLEKMVGATLCEIDCRVVMVSKNQHKVSTPQAKAVSITYRLRLKPPADIMASTDNFSAVLKKLRKLGECKVVAHLSKIPPLEALEPQECYVYWDVILTSDAGEAAITDIFSFWQGDYRLLIDVIDDGSQPDPADYRKLGEILLERGDLDPDELQNVLSAQKRLGELLVEKGLVQSDHVESALVEQQHLKEIHQDRQSQQPVGSIRVATEKLDSLVNLVGQLVTVQARLSEIAAQWTDVDGLQSVAEEVERLSAEIRDNTLGIRMLPIGSIFNKFTRLVRDLSAELGKEIEIGTSGAETELDKTVLEKIHDPLVHIIRNCIDHGIELPQVRENAGKPRRGKIHLGAVHSGDSVMITISDDGAGLDSDAIRAKALEKRLISAHDELTEHEIRNLIFAPGFSTASKVTNVSGRGVGMDVVKKSIDALRGSVEISSRRGFGSTMTIKLPLTLAIIESLLVEIGSAKFVFPLSLVDECVELDHSDLSNSHGRHVANVRGQMIPYIPLRDTFNINGQIPQQQLIVITRVDGGRVGFVVDNVIGEHQTVIKSLGRMYRDVHGLSGATIMGDGTVALIIDVPRIINDTVSQA